MTEKLKNLNSPLNSPTELEKSSDFPPPHKTLIFFDGLCEMCDRFIQFVFKKDHKKQFLYSPLQGETAKRLLNEQDISQLKSMVVCQKGLILRESQAVKAILRKLYPSLGVILLGFPDFLANVLYRQIAQRRYQWFGKKTELYQASYQQSPYFLP